MTEAPALPPLRDVIKAFGLGARKSLGQHFLLDTNLTDRIARAATPLKGRSVIEIGPGPGGLTRSLLAAGAGPLFAVERDDRCIAALAALADVYPGRLRIIAEDALGIRLSALAPPPRLVVSNLPYNISTALLLNWLDDLDGIERMILMFQREVAARLAAHPGTGAYGRLGVLTQWLCEVRILFNVDKRAFTPPPKVMSAVVEIVPRSAPLADAEKPKLERVTRAAFGQRRKMLRSSLKPLGLNPADAGIDPTRRAEDLSIDEFCALARML